MIRYLMQLPSRAITLTLGLLAEMLARLTACGWSDLPRWIGGSCRSWLGHSVLSHHVLIQHFSFTSPASGGPYLADICMQVPLMTTCEYSLHAPYCASVARNDTNFSALPFCVRRSCSQQFASTAKVQKLKESDTPFFLCMCRRLNPSSKSGTIKSTPLVVSPLSQRLHQKDAELTRRGVILALSVRYRN